MVKSIQSKLAPGPKGLAFAKSVMAFYRDPIRLFAGLHEQYGDIARLQGGPYCAHLVTQPEHIKYVLQDNARNYRLGSAFDQTTPVVGRGLTTNSGPTWLKQRRMVQSAFQHERIAAYGATITSTMEEFLIGWRSSANAAELLNIETKVLQINLRILGKLLFSVDFEEGDPFLTSLALARRVSIERARAIIQLPYRRKFLDAVKIIDGFTYSQIASHRQSKASSDILSMLIDSRYEQSTQGMSDTELHDEIMTLFFAAYEDVSNALAWACYLLAQNPSAQARLRDEIESVLGERPPSASDLRNLPYLTMLVNEVLRLYPTTWSLLRDAINDDEIDGFQIPSGSMVIIDTFLTQRLDSFWPEPNRFDPERFLPDHSAGRPRFAYFPFGGGPRQCIGNELALMEIKLILVRMLQLYRFTLPSTAPVRMNALSSLQPRGGMWMRVQPAKSAD